MSDLENRLKEALARKQAPESFTDTVMRRIDHRRKWERWSTWYGAVAALLIVALGIAGIGKYQRDQKQRAQLTERQVIYAISIAMRHFDRVNTQLKKTAPTVRLEEKHQGEEL